MRSIIVAKNKSYLVAFLVASYVVITALQWLFSEYANYFNIVWIVWFILILWLGWSFVAPILMVKEVELNPVIENTFKNLDETIAQIGLDMQTIRAKTTDAETQLDILMRLVVGFIEEADRIAKRQEGITSGNFIQVGAYDLDFANMLKALPQDKRQQTADAELSILLMYERNMREQAEALRKKVVSSRQLIYQQHLKLKGSEADAPLLKMGASLENCLNLLPHWNHNKTGNFGVLVGSGRVNQFTKGKMIN